MGAPAPEASARGAASADASSARAISPCRALAGVRLDAVDPGPEDCSYGPIGPVRCDRFVAFSATAAGLAFRAEWDERGRSQTLVGECACDGAELACRAAADAGAHAGEVVEATYDAAHAVLRWRGAEYAVKKP